MNNPFHSSEITTILVVSNIENSKKFYVDQLGAELHREYGGNSAVIKFRGHWILLSSEGGPTEDKPNTHFKVPPDPDVASHSFTIRVRDCHNSYEILKSRGIEFLTPPYDRGNEIRCFFKDPDGHLFEISEYTG